jgi:hemerythrin-like domain-containing protein
MSMNKAIHAAFRRDLDRFVDALSRLRDGDSARAEQLGRAWDNFDHQLTRHHEGEHDIAWPALVKVGVTQELLDQMDAEHDLMAERLRASRSAMTALRSAPTAANVQTARTAMAELRTVTTEHLDHEEQEIESVYVDKKDDPVIKQMGRQFGKVSPKEGGVFFAWLADGADAEAMQGIRENVPPPVLRIVGGLFGRPYRRDIAPVWSS